MRKGTVTRIGAVNRRGAVRMRGIVRRKEAVRRRVGVRRTTVTAEKGIGLARERQGSVSQTLSPSLTSKLTWTPAPNRIPGQRVPLLSHGV